MKKEIKEAIKTNTIKGILYFVLESIVNPLEKLEMSNTEKQQKIIIKLQEKLINNLELKPEKKEIKTNREIEKYRKQVTIKTLKILINETKKIEMSKTFEYLDLQMIYYNNWHIFYTGQVYKDFKYFDFNEIK